ncbi:MAG TPA: acyl-[acyl-carrier-protein]--UDP-N-acetylglucosamine O-acyltransferase, partial [Nitrospirae bacterium]|nr:acyl-[acyl-carrier-protein]--UDP-N-acetylglucosamine O-acyltransferase [Nitrospirota bacterium]
GGMSGIGQDIPPYMIASGARAKLFGLNTVGLKRHGFTDESVSELKKAYRILFREKNTLKNAIKKVQEEVPYTGEIQHLLDFINEKRRGICR